MTEQPSNARPYDDLPSPSGLSTMRGTTAKETLYIARVVGGSVLNEGHSMVHIRKSGLHG
jgi:hypothetical protein